MQLAVQPPEDDGAIRVMMGPQADYFTPETIYLFLENDFTVSALADRMVPAHRAALEHAKGFNIVSDGIVDGHIQVPGSGQPIVLMRDRQTAGGCEDRHRDQRRSRPRARPQGPPCVQSSGTGRGRAPPASRRLKDAAQLAASPLLLQRPFNLTTEHLLSRNLIGGTVDAFAPTPHE